ncbi:hypothetical protein [Halovenus halobia]|uniref:hypothetical protein n=1 Tax=Halovenus halobia TaxID=3396622 RepID=UPI003F5773EE
MANLSPGDDRRSDRAQLILVTAFALAAIFLGLAIIVNSAIFTENLATRSENVDSTEALEYRHSTTQAVGNVIGYANKFNSTGTDPTPVWRSVSRSIGELNDYTGIQQARSGTAVALELNSTTNGSRIFQTDGTSFESNRSNASWTLADNVDQTRAFEINASNIDNPFSVIVNDSSNTWEAEIDSGSITVTRPSGASETCSETIETVDLTDGTVNGEPCPALIDTENGEPLHFGAGVGPDYTVRFENADEIFGNYSLVVDNTSLSSSNDNYADVGGPGDGPRVTPAMYSAIVEMHYQTPEIEYHTLVRVAPGEPR